MAFTAPEAGEVAGALVVEDLDPPQEAGVRVAEDFQAGVEASVAEALRPTGKSLPLFT